MRPIATLPFAALAVLAAPAMAREATVAVPAGRLSDVAIALARQTGSSIVVSDPLLASRRVRGLRGRMDAAEAVARLARAARVRVLVVGPSAWRLVELPPPAKPARLAPPPPPALVTASPEVEAKPIVVIASKRELPLGELPGQVSILDGASLELGGIGGTEKITRRIATVSSTYLGSGRNKLFIRGIADSSFTGPTQATVGQYLGDLRLSYNAPDPDLRLSDLERVEVLEGPQGTLYGAGSLGGIIRLVPRAPELGETSLSVMGGAAATQHGEPGGDVHATVNLPVAANFAALRVNFDAASLGGYIDKPWLGRRDVNRTRIVGGRANLRFELAPEWTFDLIALGQSTRAEDSQYADRDGPRLVSSAQVAEGARADYGQTQAVLAGRIGAVRFRSSTGFARQELEERYDATLAGGPVRQFIQRNETQMIANETRLWQPMDNGFGWLAGFSFIDNDTRLTRSLGAPDAQMRTTGVRNTVSELTGYGEASLRVFGPFIASAGARVTRSRLGGEGEDVPLLLAIARAEITASRTETAFLPSASLLAELGQTGRAYVRYQEGFRPGGLAIAGEFVHRFASDRAATIELGTGLGTPGRGAFDISASLAHTRWHDIQADFIDEAGLPTTANIGDARIWTASVAAGAALASGLRLEGGATYNDSKIAEPLELAALARATHVPNIARFSGRLGLTWHGEIGDGFIVDAESWASYVGKSRLGVGPELGAPQGDYLDSGAQVRIGRDNFGVTVSLTNIADTQGNRFALGTPFAIGREQVTPLQPRTLRIGLDSRF